MPSTVFLVRTLRTRMNSPFEPFSSARPDVVSFKFTLAKDMVTASPFRTRIGR